MPSMRLGKRNIDRGHRQAEGTWKEICQDTQKGREHRGQSLLDEKWQERWMKISHGKEGNLRGRIIKQPQHELAPFVSMRLLVKRKIRNMNMSRP